jgi:RNA-binding protein
MRERMKKTMSNASKSASKAAPKPLEKFQVTWLRSKAHELSPIVIVGQSGVTDGVVEATKQALFDHELIKVRMNRPEDKQAMAKALAEQTQSQLCGLIGHTVILYRANEENPRVSLPKRKSLPKSRTL